MKRNYIFLALILFCWRGYAVSEVLVNAPFENVVKLAKERNQPIVLEFYTTWCPPCRTLEKEVFTKSEIKERFEHIVFARYDSDTSIGWKVHQEWKVRMWPTFIALNSSGVEKTRRLGPYADAKDFSDFLDAHIAGVPLTVSTGSNAAATYAELIKASEEGQEGLAMRLILKLERQSPNNEDELVSKSLFSISEMYRGMWRYDKAIQYLKRLLDKYPESSSVEEASYLLELNYRRQSLETVIAIYKSMIEKYPKKIYWYDAFADLCATNRYRLPDGFEMARKAIELKPKNASLYDTLAKLYYTKGDLAAAIETLVKANDLDEKNPQRMRTLAMYRVQLAIK